MTSAAEAALRWKVTWEEGWPKREVEPILALYAPGATYRALAFREPDLGEEDIRTYLRSNFETEQDIVCRFAEPVVSGDRVAIEWWASWIEAGEPITLAGVTILRFRSDGLIVDHCDYWNQEAGRIEPYQDWLDG